MKVALINTKQSGGGAAVAACRLHKALREEGVDATLVVTGEATGIDGVTANGKKAELFDLSGRKLNAQPVKGVYIQNGKKVVR